MIKFAEFRHLCSVSSKLSAISIHSCYRSLLLRLILFVSLARLSYFCCILLKIPSRFLRFCHSCLLCLLKCPFFLRFIFYSFLSLVGFVILKALKPRNGYVIGKLDLFFVAVSAATDSSLSTVEMEAFSDDQLLVIGALMFAGGKIFTSLMGLHLQSRRGVSAAEPNSGDPFVRREAVRFLGLAVLGYLLTAHVAGVVSVLIYLAAAPSAANVLKRKRIKVSTFAVFMVVSTFSNGGFVPTNEGMVAFRRNSGLLLILLPLVLLGGTMFPPLLRLLISALGRKVKKPEADYLLNNSVFSHLLSSLHSRLLAATVLFFIVTGAALFSATEWNSPALAGLSRCRKLVAVVFQSTNARHAGECVVDIATLAPVALVFFLVMMSVAGLLHII